MDGLYECCPPCHSARICVYIFSMQELSSCTVSQGRDPIWTSLPPSVRGGVDASQTTEYLLVQDEHYYVHKSMCVSVCVQDFSELVLENLLYPMPVDRTKIPTVYPIQKGITSPQLLCILVTRQCCQMYVAISKLEHDTRCWPLVYNDTILYTIKQVSLPPSVVLYTISVLWVDQ